MGRIAQSFALLTLGALAAGAGTVVVVYRANNDRSALISQAQQARAQAEETTRNTKDLVAEANKKVETAGQEVAKAQARIQALEVERRMLANAIPLTKPKTAAGWKEFVSMPLGFTISLPTPNVEPQFTQTSFDAGWLLISKYNGEPVAYDKSFLLQNHLLIGSSTETSWTYLIQSNGEPTMLIRAYTNANITDKTVLDVLSTLTFKD
ncbi:MAG: hypothetical protein WCK01_04255 [Candidatus Uhrbacteria bacterium]